MERKYLRDHIIRNELNDTEDEKINASTASEVVQTENEEASFLKDYINAKNNLSAQVEPSAEDTKILDEPNCFEITFTRSEKVQKLYNCMFTIKATSVEAERAFSAACLCKSKLRTNLSEKTIDSLCFLRDYFKK